MTQIDTTTQAWGQQLQQAIRSLPALYRALNLAENHDLPEAEAHPDFPVLVTQSLLRRMRPPYADDPILKQILPTRQEQQTQPGFTTDPLQEQYNNPVPGILHKYHDRALLTLTGSCPIHCRYCFRRHFPYNAQQPNDARWADILAYLKQNPGIQEIILSGGDPLMLTDRHLTRYLQDLAALPQLKRLRIHSRMPIALPDRLTDSLLTLLSQQRLQTILVMHSNHPQELDTHVANTLQPWRLCNITLLNQSVLLRGINDNVNTLAALSERLFEIGVLPYYLHLLDPVAGAAAFQVPKTEALALYHALQARLSGYLVPTLVQEQPQHPNKTRL